MTEICIVGDVIELEGQAVATLVAELRLSQRDDLIAAFDLDGGVWKILPSLAKPRRRGDQSRSALGPTAPGANRARPGCQNATRTTSGSSRR